MRIALARIASGQSDIALVGGAYNAERSDVLMLYEFGGYCLEGEFRPVWERGPRAASRSARSARSWCWRAARMREARGAKPIARLSAATSGYSNRADPRRDRRATLERLWTRIAPALDAGTRAVISGAIRRGAGDRGGTRIPQHAIAELAGARDRDPIGHGIEPQFA